MKPLSLVSMFLADETLVSMGVLIIVLGGCSIMVGLRRCGGAAVAAGIGVAMLPVLLPIIEKLLTDVLSGLPWWVGPLLLVAVGLTILRLFGDLLLGRHASAHMVGTLAASVVTFIVLLPFRGVAGLIRMLRGR